VARKLLLCLFAGACCNHDHEKVTLYEFLFDRLSLESSSGRCRPAVDSLLSLHASCRSSDMVGTLEE
jgi:hypothetical protein